MAQYTNSQVLSAVINKWAQPMIQSFAGSKMSSLPFIQGLENKIRSTGWVSQKWCLLPEISPIMESLTGKLVAPILNAQFAKMDDKAIPDIAHSVVDNAIGQGKLSLFEGKVEIELDDLQELKRLLNLNLPISEADAGVYEVITE